MPANASTFTIHEAHIYAGRIGDNYRHAISRQNELEAVCDLVDEKEKETALKEPIVFQHFDPEELPPILGGLTIEDRALFCLAPVPWRDPRCVLVMRKLIKMYRKMFKTDLGVAIEGLGFMEALEGIESHGAASGEESRNTTASKRRQGKDKASEIGQFNQATLSALESFHKIIGVYLWMSFRNPASWVQRQEVGALKLRVEDALERCLEGLSRKTANDRTLEEFPIEDSEQELSDPGLEKLAIAC